MQGVTSPQNYQVAEYYNYQPFGQAIQASGSYATPYKFTGKERDQHSTFDFDYFGARYYDSRTGGPPFRWDDSRMTGTHLKGLLKNPSIHEVPSNLSLQRMLEPILTLCRTRLDASFRWHDRNENFALIPFFNRP